MEAFLARLDAFLQWQFPENVQQWVNLVLLWFGFSFAVGLVARLVVPGKIARGGYSVILTGLTGSCVGLLVVSTWRNLKDFNPICPAGFVVGVVSSILILMLFHTTRFLFPFGRKPKEGK